MYHRCYIIITIIAIIIAMLASSLVPYHNRYYNTIIIRILCSPSSSVFSLLLTTTVTCLKRFRPTRSRSGSMECTSWSSNTKLSRSWPHLSSSSVTCTSCVGGLWPASVWGRRARVSTSWACPYGFVCMGSSCRCIVVWCTVMARHRSQNCDNGDPGRYEAAFHSCVTRWGGTGIDFWQCAVMVTL